MSADLPAAGSGRQANGAPIRVLVVDDSAVVRMAVAEALARAPGIEVIATASDPLFALERMRRDWPDVIILDVEMPRMDGLSFLRRIMAERPTPVIICSSLVAAGTTTLMQALAAGAVSVIGKPTTGVRTFLADAANDIAAAVRAAARANLRALVGRPVATDRPDVRPGGERLPGALASFPPVAGEVSAATTGKLIAIGTSTGGTQALEAILPRLPRSVPGIVIVQHMPAQFTAMFAARLNTLCAIEIREAADNDRVLPGTALIAPGGRHLVVRRSGAQYGVGVVDGPLVNRHKPSVDVLFRSVARAAGRNALGVILTGMGDDGARGLGEMRAAGAATIAQDEASCVVFGMPAQAIKHGAVDRVLPLDQIAAVLLAATG